MLAYYRNFPFQKSCGPLDKIEIFVEDDRYNAELIPDYKTSGHDGDFAEAFCRLQNASIKNFGVGISDYTFLRCFTVQETTNVADGIDAFTEVLAHQEALTASITSFTVVGLLRFVGRTVITTSGSGRNDHPATDPYLR